MHDVFLCDCCFTVIYMIPIQVMITLNSVSMYLVVLPVFLPIGGPGIQVIHDSLGPR